MKKQLLLTLLAFFGIIVGAKAEVGLIVDDKVGTIDDVSVCNHSYVLVFDDWDGAGTAKPGKGKLFGDGYFLDVTGGTVATNKQAIDLSDEGYCDGEYTKYAEYGKHLNSWRLKNAQDVIAMKVTQGSKIIILGQKHASRYPKIALNAALTEGVQTASKNTVSENGRFEWVADNDYTIYIGSEGGDYYVSYLIVEAYEAEGTPSVKVSDLKFENGLYFYEVTAEPAQAYGMDTEVYYTTDGTDPTPQSTKYTEPIKCYKNGTIKFQAVLMGALVPDAVNEANVDFRFDAPTITAEGANVTIASAYENATNKYSLNAGDTIEGNSVTLTESATVLAYTEIKNGSYATFKTNSATKDVYILDPIKKKQTVSVNYSSIDFLDDMGVYVVNGGKVNADNNYFFVKDAEFAAVMEGVYQVNGEQAYLKMNKTNVTFNVAEGDSVWVKVVCSKNSCKDLENDPRCYVRVDSVNYGHEDVTAANGNIIEFGLGSGYHTFKKYPSTGNILISSITITPIADMMKSTIEARLPNGYGSVEIQAGTVIGANNDMEVAVAYDDTYSSWDGLGSDIFCMPYYVIDGEKYGIRNTGLFGQTNPRDSLNKLVWKSLAAPASGCVYSMKAKKDGYAYVWGVFASGKPYTVFEDGKAMGYRLSMITEGWSWYDNEYLLGCDRLDLMIGRLGEEVVDTIPSASEMVVGTDTVMLYGMGVMMFPVKAGSTYLFNNCAGKFIFGGVHFSQKDNSIIELADENDNRFMLYDGSNDKLIYQKYQIHVIPSEEGTITTDVQTVEWGGQAKVVVKANENYIIDRIKVSRELIDSVNAETYELNFDNIRQNLWINAKFKLANAAPGTLDNPLTVAQAIEMASALELGQSTEQDYYIKGRIDSIRYNFVAQYGNATFFIADTTSNEHFLIYATKYLENSSWVDGQTQIALNDEVIIYGKLTNYKGTPETLANQSYIYSLNGRTTAENVEVTQVDTISVARAVEITSKFDAGVISNKFYIVKGIVDRIVNNSLRYNDLTFIIRDENTGDTIQAYRCLGFDKELVTDENLVMPGDVVMVMGKLFNYRGTYELAESCHLISIERQTANTDNMFYASEQLSLAQGATGIQPISLKNSEKIYAFQFDLLLPEGINVAVKVNDDEKINDISYGNRTKSTHVIASEYQADGSLRIVGYSSNNVSFTDNDGVLLNITFTASENIAVGEYSAKLFNARITNIEGDDIILDDQVFTICVVEPGLRGDANNDAQVSMGDVVAIVNKVLGKDVPGFNEKNADVNGDGTITMGDVVGVVNIVLGKDMTASSRAAQPATLGTLNLQNSDYGVSFMLDNPTAYTAFQMDVTLTEGTRLMQAVLSDRGAKSHTVSFSQLSDGRIRIVGYSMQNADLKGVTGELLSLAVEGQGLLSIDEALFFTADGTQHRLAVGEATAINTVTSVKGADTIYNLKGQRVLKAQNGLYIINGMKLRK